MSIITLELLSKIKYHYKINWFGIHGVIHMSRVFDNGQKLAEQDGVNRNVIDLFSIFHDSQRRNEHYDKNHGKRGGELALKLRKYLPIDDEEVQQLYAACCFHTGGTFHEDKTIMACWDSDRLDLGRVNIVPDPNLLCTPLSKTDAIINWAYGRSLVHEFPDNPFNFDEDDDR